MNQLCGTVNGVEIIPEDNKFIENIKEYIPTEFLYNVFKYLNDDGACLYVFKIELNQDPKPILFSLAGFSNNSFSGTTKVILGKLKDLGTKFSEIYMFEYESLKPLQDKACCERDESL